MNRLPLPQLADRPTCFAISHDADADECRACAHRTPCIIACKPWASRLSLSELAHAERRKLTEAGWANVDGNVGLVTLFDRLYEKHLGSRPRRRKSNVSIVRAMNCAARFCDDRGLDLTLYVAAQMVAMRDGVVKHPYGFQPNLLLGERALGRYNAYARKLNRRYHHAGETALTDADRALREALFASEVSLGAHLTASAVNGKKGDPNDADVRDAWRAAVYGMSADSKAARQIYIQLLKSHDPSWIAAALMLARLEAACVIADRYGPCLSDRIGVGPAGFTWEAFADLIAVMFAKDVTPEPAELSPQVAEFSWKPGG